MFKYRLRDIETYLIIQIPFAGFTYADRKNNPTRWKTFLHFDGLCYRVKRAAVVVLPEYILDFFYYIVSCDSLKK